MYDLPHFDVHFYIEPIEKIFAIESGPCGPEFVRCDQFKLATKLLPANYMHGDFKNVDAVAPAMGNHLIDPTSAEFNGKKFTRTWIYGVYDGRVTFFEEMLTREYMLSRPAACFPIKSPPAVNVKGYYPTQSCTRYHSQANVPNTRVRSIITAQRPSATLSRGCAHSLHWLAHNSPHCDEMNSKFLRDLLIAVGIGLVR